MENSITINNLSEVTINGVTKVFSATPTETALEINGKNLLINGNNMEVKKLDVEHGEVCILGEFASIKVTDAKSKEGLLKRIFK